MPPTVNVPTQVAQLGYQQLEMRKKIAAQVMLQRQRAAAMRAAQQQAQAQQAQLTQPTADPMQQMMMQQQQLEEEERRRNMVEALSQKAGV